MADDGHVQKYRCNCSGGDWCFIVRHPKESIPVSYPTLEEAGRELNKIRQVSQEV
jgi:hypothetical protein